jgi:lipoate-protein ligase A
MLLIDNNGVTDPAINLALEEYSYRNLDPADDYLVFYINQPSIIIGNHQNPFQEVNFEFAVQKKIRPVRRISGGGTVYHDPGNLNFSFITDFSGEMLNYFKTLLQPVLTTLQRLGVSAQLTEKNNIIVEGKKISGNSQHTNMKRMLSHGTLLFDARLDILHRVLEPRLKIIHSRAIPSIRSNVTNISNHLRRSMNMQTFLAELTAAISDAFGRLQVHQLTAGEWAAVHRLAEEKYRSWDWSFGRSPEFTVANKVNLDFRKVEALITVKHGIIKKIQLPNNSLNPQTHHQVIDGLMGKRYGSGETDQLLRW